MSFLGNFAAIDFETANRRRDSACQLGAVIVESGEIVREQVWMIRPEPFFFSPSNIRIHGIRPSDVDSAETFGECWDSIQSFLGDHCLIAHNAAFDLGVLIGCLQRHRISTPSLKFSCTRLIAKQTWPERPRFGLKPLSTWLGVDFRHHDALEDARACAKVLIAAGIAKGASTLEDLETRLRIVRGKAGEWGISQASQLGRKRRRDSKRSSLVDRRKGIAKRALRRSPGRMNLPLMNPFDEPSAIAESPATYETLRGTEAADSITQSGSIDWQRLSIRAELIQPLRGKRILICGRLRQLSDKQAIELTEKAGGHCQTDADGQTNCIVLGHGESAEHRLGELKSKDQIECLTEGQFLERLGLSL
ncbi:MAG: exonuclease domain-containing protein [Planctomycetota bacterium]